MGLEFVNECPDEWRFLEVEAGRRANGIWTSWAKFEHKEGRHQTWLQCPYGKPGDVLYTRENLRQKDGIITYAADDVIWMSSGDYHYRYEEYEGMVPSIHMPKRAARIWDEVVSIRVERVQDITERDAIKEAAPMYVPGHGVVTQADIQSDPGYRNFINHKMGFEHLWESINGPGSYNLNPFVWVVSTKNLSTRGKPASL